MRVRAFLVLATLMCAATPVHATPTNDSFASAVSIPSIPWSTSRSTVGATLQTGERQPTCGHTAATVWYKLTVAQTTPVGVSAFNSAYDTTLAVYTGSAVNTLLQTSCSDDAGTRKQSMVGWLATAGKTYYIQAGTGLESAPGILRLRVAYGQKIDGTLAAPGPNGFTLIFPYAASATADKDTQEGGVRLLAGLCPTEQFCFSFDIFDADFDHKTVGGGIMNVCYNIPAQVCYKIALP